MGLTPSAPRNFVTACCSRMVELESGAFMFTQPLLQPK